MSEITEYESLLSVAASNLGRAVTPGAMTLLTADLNRRLRVREMVGLSEQTDLTLPADFASVDTLKVADAIYSPTLEGMQYPSRECTYAVVGGSLVLYPEETAPEIWLRYYRKLAVLETGQTNDVLLTYPDVYLYGLLYHHARLVRDEAGAAAWGPAYAEAMTEAKKADFRSRTASSESLKPVYRVAV